jgi:hypothetical protein
LLEISFGKAFIFFYALMQKRNKKNQSAAVDKMKLVRTVAYSLALVGLTSQVNTPAVVT